MDIRDGRSGWVGAQRWLLLLALVAVSIGAGGCIPFGAAGAVGKVLAGGPPAAPPPPTSQPVTVTTAPIHFTAPITVTINGNSSESTNTEGAAAPVQVSVAPARAVEPDYADCPACPECPDTICPAPPEAWGNDKMHDALRRP